MAVARVFEGIRILEFGGGAAGPLATRYFAEHGADVVRIESAKRPDFLRLLPFPGARQAGAAPASGPDLDAAPMFAALNPDKRSVALDLTKAEGAALARRLAGWADVVTENFSPGVMERLGLGYEALREVRPDLIMVSGCLFGQTGPQRSYPGFGGQGSAIAGFNHLTGWPDREAVGPFATITDSLSPRFIGVLLAGALRERRRTGRGRYFDLSQIEAGIYALSEMVVRHSITGESLVRSGNRDEHSAPHAVYPCSGEDRWIAVTARTDAEWEALVREMGAPEWTRDERFRSAEGRKAGEEEIDERIAGWTCREEAGALAERLQAAGVPAGAVQRPGEVLDDPQLAHRGHFVTLDHPVLGPLASERSGFRLSASPGALSAPAPLLGEHTRQVLAEILGLADAEIERLGEDGVLA
jgi:benzylsuccinate CoA-transferase BbsF subunit